MSSPTPVWSLRVRRAHELLELPPDFREWPPAVRQQLALLQQRTVVASESFAAMAGTGAASLAPRLERERAFLAEITRALAR